LKNPRYLEKSKNRDTLETGKQILDEICHDDASRPGFCQPMKFDVHSCLGLVGQLTLACTKRLGQKHGNTTQR